MSNIDFENLAPSHFKQVLAIADTCFGHQYLSENQLENYTGKTGFSLVLILNNKIIGFCLNEKTTKPNRQNSFLKMVDSIDFPAGIIKTIAIEPKFQHQGYGAKLLDVSVSKLMKQNVKSLFYPAWNENNCERFLLKLKKIHFAEVTVIPNYWRSESVKNNYHCARCGPPPCQCSLSLFYRKVNPEII